MTTPPLSPTPIALPVAGSAPQTRADAMRNRERILEAASRLFDERGVDCVSMDAIAEEAGVGKGTLFRRFGDRSALLWAVLQESETAFQEGFIRGPAPLGPGAPADERLTAFGEGLLDHVERNGELLLAALAGVPGLRFRTPVYGAYLAHVLSLLREARPAVDLEYAADALLATLSVELVMHQRHARGIDLETLKAGWRGLVRALLRA
jgi:AcrR family transcriptional regulator